MSTATSDLIDRLTAELSPVRQSAAVGRLIVGLGVGGIVAAIAMMVWLGLRADFSAALLTPSFWIKFVYTGLLALAGLLAVERLGRPGERPRSGAILGLVALAGVAALALGQMLTTSARGDMTMLFGNTASFCPVAIVILSVPIFAGLAWALRGLAPTRLTLAGAGAGFAAGALAAFVYSFSCGETGIPFLASWYTLGSLVAALLGALFGRTVLRW